MRLIAAIACTLVLVTAVFADEKPDTGDVHVLAHVGARVYVDGHLAGVSLGEKLGFTVQNLPAGNHTLRVTRTDYGPRELTVTIKAGTTAEVNMDDLKIRRRIKVRPREEPVDMTVGSPPMKADDSGTPGAGNWEINTVFDGDFARGQHLVEAPLFDINYGLGEDVQIKYEVPWVVLREPGEEGQPSRKVHGVGNSLLGLKYRFYDEEESGLSLAVYPQLGFRTPGSKSRDDGGVGEPASFLLPLLLTKDFSAASITANTSLEKTSGDSHINLSAVFGVGTRLSQNNALLSELAVDDLNSSDARRFTVRLGARRKIDENHVLFAALGVDLNGGDDDLHHRYITFGYQRFIGSGRER